jgi:Asp-tRNA(Asn)/Glu-tRNA(Gln) amidotransferase A subunit family amidase
MPGSRTWSIAELNTQIDSGLSPVTLVEECLERVSRGNASNNAMIFVDADSALEAAREAAHERGMGRLRGPLHGLPIVVKDMIDVKGWPTTAGSHLFGGHVALADAVCVANLRSAGAIILGKSNLHELTVGGHANPWYGKVVNPLDASCGTGGTSSGSAAAVAARFCIAAIGTDAGGSNRSPAAATGLVGFKPTNGLIDLAGVRATAPSLDVIGPLATTVEDVRLVTEAMAGRKLPSARAYATSGATMSEVVLAVCPALYGSDVDPSIAHALEAWLARLRQAGARVIDMSADGTDAFVGAGLSILQYEFATEYRLLIERNPDLVGEMVRSFLESATRIGRVDYDAALAVRERFRLDFLDRMQGIDALIVPTSPGLAPRLSDEMTRVGREWVGFGMAGGRFRRWANMLGMPAVALPLACGGKLPASIQLAACPGADGPLLALAAALCADPELGPACTWEAQTP